MYKYIEHNLVYDNSHYSLKEPMALLNELIPELPGLEMEMSAQPEQQITIYDRTEKPMSLDITPPPFLAPGMVDRSVRMKIRIHPAYQVPKKYPKMEITEQYKSMFEYHEQMLLRRKIVYDWLNSLLCSADISGTYFDMILKFRNEEGIFNLACQKVLPVEINQSSIVEIIEGDHKQIGWTEGAPIMNRISPDIQVVSSCYLTLHINNFTLQSEE